MIPDHAVMRFMSAALECSIYISPVDPGLTFSELVEVAQMAGFLEGEIHDTISHVVAPAFGSMNEKLQLDKNQAIMLHIFHGKEEPEFRNVAAFTGVFTVMRQLTREKGIANTFIDRPDLIKRVVNDGITESDVQITVSILVLNDVLSDKDGVISFVRGKERYGSPGDNGNAPLRMPVIRKDDRARAYPIVKEVVDRRTSPPAPVVSASSASVVDTSSDEWLSAAAALDVLGGSYSSATRAICQRAYASLISARAKRFVRDERKTDNVSVPSEFWWAKGEAALNQNWSVGDFDTWIDKRFHLKVFGVEFRRSDIETMVEPSRKQVTVRGNKVFIVHGHDEGSREAVARFLDRIGLEPVILHERPNKGNNILDSVTGRLYGFRHEHRTDNAGRSHPPLRGHGCNA